MVIRFDFEADARNFALLQSLYMKMDIFFLSYRNTGGMMCVLLNSQPGGNIPCHMYFMIIRQKGQIFNTLAFSSMKRSKYLTIKYSHPDERVNIRRYNILTPTWPVNI